MFTRNDSNAKCYDLRSNSYVIVDVETTGFSPYNSRVIEIGAIKIINNEIHSQLDILIKTVDSIPFWTTRFTGITNDEFSSKAIEAQEGFNLFRDFAEELTFVAHNVSFDYNFISKELERYQIDPIKRDLIDTVRVARQKFPFLPNHKLTTIKDYLKINSVSHRGLADAMVCWEIMKAN